MQIRLIAIGTRMPAWVEEGYREYARRLPRECRLVLTEIAPGRRGKSQPVARAIEEEGRRMLAAIGRDDRVIALDERGRGWSSAELARELAGWMRDGRDVSLLVGGPDGLAPDCLARARQHWSLSPLTLPHPLVRVVAAEQLYRAWSLHQGHPYHRA
ncbi:MAG TPA: 23S rRNA (pseudouridine(1915)-N(3))-methyltransferase RlmH [Gammaproteobacteria bacterium]|nr:23S rRNA (pseudouridine(1915)-N(3))-methyltransferase RlmH [Gammaproteobacteria bacterium]